MITYENLLIKMIGTHRTIAPSMYRGIGLSAVEEAAMRSVLDIVWDDVKLINEMHELANEDTLASDGWEMIEAAMRKNDSI